MKKKLTLLLAVLLALSLPGCGKPSAETKEPSTAEAEIQTEPATEAPLFDLGARAAYQAALERVTDQMIFPDGTQVPYDEVSGPMEDNKFAVADLDGDGREELLLAFTTSYIGGMQTHVYGYDQDADALHRQLLEFPSLTFYENGMVKAEASHNHTLAGDTFWPHQMYAYDPAADAYEKTVFLDAWDRSLAEEDYEGSPYPQEVDTENAGIVYLVYQGEWGGQHEILSRSDFARWSEDFFADAQPVKIPYQNLTAENIAAITEP